MKTPFHLFYFVALLMAYLIGVAIGCCRHARHRGTTSTTNGTANNNETATNNGTDTNNGTTTNPGPTPTKCIEEGGDDGDDVGVIDIRFMGKWTNLGMGPGYRSFETTTAVTRKAFVEAITNRTYDKLIAYNDEEYRVRSMENDNGNSELARPVQSAIERCTTDDKGEHQTFIARPNDEYHWYETAESSGYGLDVTLSGTIHQKKVDPPPTLETHTALFKFHIVKRQ